MRTASGAVLKAKSVIFPPMPAGGDERAGRARIPRPRRGLTAPHCDGPLFKTKRVAVIGGGNSGVEAAIDLAGIVAHVTLLEFADQLRADAVLQKKMASLPNVDGGHRRRPPRCTATGRRSVGLSRQGPHERRRPPSNSKASSCRSVCCRTPTGSKGTVALRNRGEIEIDARGQTSVPGCSPPAMRRRCPTSRSSSPWVPGPRALGAFDHLDPQPGGGGGACLECPRCLRHQRWCTAGRRTHGPATAVITRPTGVRPACRRAA